MTMSVKEVVLFTISALIVVSLIPSIVNGAQNLSVNNTNASAIVIVLAGLLGFILLALFVVRSFDGFGGKK